MDETTPEAETSTFPMGIPLLDESATEEVPTVPEMLIVTGMSGAGRTRAAMALEDLDWYVVDNLPPRMLPALAGMMTPDGGGVHRLGAVVDVRSREFFTEFMQVLDELEAAGIHYRVIFLEAQDSTLVRRYEQVRRPHPLQGNGRILDGIRKEKGLLAELRNRCDAIIDTTDMSVHDLARHVRDVIAGEADRPLRLTIMSFGFKYGLPLDADHVVDMRFLANPYWVSELRHLTGKDEAVSDYVLELPGARDFIQGYADLLGPILQKYLSELKPFVTIAVGCTGGKHRSVATTEALSLMMRDKGFPVHTVHRDLGRE